MKLAFALLVLACVACGSAITPVPVGNPLTITQLKLRVIDNVGVPVYCDRDFYPIARQGGEQANAIAKYPEIRADAELYSAIVAHEHLSSGDLTDAEKLIVYRVYKNLSALTLTLTAAGDGYTFKFLVRSKTGSASYLMTIGSVRTDGTISISSQTPSAAPPCPICLAASTLIATPSGPVRVTDIESGMLVWTAAPDGSRIAAPVVEVGSTAVPADHLMVHLVLGDGRELLVSPGHRTADGRALGSLSVGEQLDGSRITLWELVPYAGARTYDLLPAGPTGHYWANGVLLASTLA